MDSWKVALIDQTTNGVVPPGDIRRYADALQQQVDDHLAPAWGVRADISVLPPGGAVPQGTWPIRIVDALAGMSGVHRDDHGQPYAEAVTGDQLSSTLSHELLEMLVDPQGARFIKAPCLDRNFAGRLVCYLVEVADPVEPYSYEIGGVQVADFVLPSFFDPGATGHVDFNGFLPGPLTVPLGCYISWFDPIGHRWHEQKPDGTFHIGLPTLSRVSRADRDLAYGAAERGRHDATEIYRAWPGEVRRVPGPGSPPPG